MIGKNTVRVILLFAFVILYQVVAPSGLSLAAEKGAVGVVDAAVSVDVIVNIDKDTRVISLKNEAAETYNYTAGPEVKNFDQLKRGDLVIMEYYSGFAIGLKKKDSGKESGTSMLNVETAKRGEKPGMKVTGAVYLTAKIVSIDQENRIVILEGKENVVALKVSDDINLNNIDVGEEVEAVYAESYAISVKPAPKVSGIVDIETTAVAVGIGVSWGKGTLTMYDESNHEFSVQGLSVIDVGVTKVEAKGEVYNLVEAKDLEGTFIAGEAGATMIAGGSVLALKNENGVVIKLKSTQKGLRLTLSGQGLSVKLK